MVRLKRPIEERFWNLVNKDGSISEWAPDGQQCWLWISAIDKDGYGKIWGSNERVHRLSYRFAYGLIPEGLTIDHLCFVPACVNPNHLSVVPNIVNASRQRRRDGKVLRAKDVRTLYCAHEAHEKYHEPSGKPRCRACARETLRTWRAKQ